MDGEGLGMLCMGVGSAGQGPSVAVKWFDMFWNGCVALVAEVKLQQVQRSKWNSQFAKKVQHENLVFLL